MFLILLGFEYYQSECLIILMKISMWKVKGLAHSLLNLVWLEGWKKKSE